VVVCTLCSCYPWPILGLPPTWYKSAPYRARVVSEPRAVLREFGLELPAEVRRRALFGPGGGGSRSDVVSTGSVALRVVVGVGALVPSLPVPPVVG